MYPIRRIIPFLLGLCALLTWSAGAAAQISIVSGTLQRETENHDQGLDVISREDCEGNEYEITISGLTSGETIQVWVSQDQPCDQQVNRNQSSGGTCRNTGISVTGTGDANEVITLPMGDLVNALDDIDGCVDSTGNQTTQGMDVYFLVNVSSADTTNFATQALSYDLVGPAAPEFTALDASGETSLSASFNASSATDVLGFRIYCEQVGSSSDRAADVGGGGTGGTGTGGTGGSSAGGSGGMASTTTASSSTTTTTTAGSGGGSAACAASQLVEGELPPTDLEVGSTNGTTATSVEATGLTQTEYACGIAAVDQLNNQGVLSNVICATPEEVEDFFEALRDGGINPGGGYCQCTMVGADREHDWAVWATTALLLGLAMRRHGRERNRR